MLFIKKTVLTYTIYKNNTIKDKKNNSFKLKHFDVGEEYQLRTLLPPENSYSVKNISI